MLGDALAATAHDLFTGLQALFILLAILGPLVLLEYLQRREGRRVERESEPEVIKAFDQFPKPDSREASVRFDSDQRRAA